MRTGGVLSRVRFEQWLPTTVGVAIGNGKLHACIRGLHAAQVELSVDLEPLAPNTTDWPSLYAGLLEVGSKCGERPRRLDIVLEPPLVDVRRVTLPRLRATELLHVLTRDARRYFLGAAAARVVAAHYVVADRRNPAEVIAAAVPASTVVSIRTAAERAGWRVNSIAPAHTAWMASRKGARGAGSVVVDVGPHLEAVSWIKGCMVDVRRSSGDASVAGSLCAAERTRTGARFAGVGAATLQFVDDAMRQERQCRDRRRAKRVLVMGGAAMLILGVAGLLRTHSELTAFRAEHTSNREIVARSEALIARRQAEWLRAHAIDSVASSAPRWSGVLVDLASILPPDSYLEAFHGSGDTVMATVVGPNPAAVLRSVSRPAMFSEQRLGTAPTPVADGATLQRFGLRVRVALDTPSNPDS